MLFFDFKGYGSNLYMTTEDYIKKTLNDLRPKSQKINHFNPNLKDNSARMFKVSGINGNKFEIYAFSRQIEIGVKLSTSLHFAINNPENICGADKKLRNADFFLKLFVRVPDDGANIIRAVNSLKSEIENLTLQHDEAIFIYKNAIDFVANPHRLILPELNFLSQFKSSLEHHFPEEIIRINISNIPDELADLIPLLEEWAIPNDSEREEKVKKASKAVLRKIIGIVSPKMGLINSYLDSFGSKPLSHEATLTGNLAELVSELMLQKGLRNE